MLGNSVGSKFLSSSPRGKIEQCKTSSLSEQLISDCDYCHGPIDEIHQSPEKPWGLHLRQKFVNYKQNSPACRECRNHHKPMAYLVQGKDMKACNMESFADEIDLQVKDGQDMMRYSANICKYVFNRLDQLWSIDQKFQTRKLLMML